MSWNNISRCVICGKPIEHRNRGRYAYCLEHRAYARRDEKILDEMPTELLFALIAGIFTRARIDYLTNADGKKNDAEWFFRSEWAQELSLSQFDPDKVLKLMDEDIENGLTEIGDDSDGAEW